MQHVEFLGRVPARVQNDGLLASWVVGQELGYIQHLVTNDHPAVVLLVVLGNLLLCERLATRRRGRRSL